MRSVIRDGTWTQPSKQTNLVFPVNDLKKKKTYNIVGSTPRRPWLPRPLSLFWLTVITCGPTVGWEPLCAAYVALTGQVGLMCTLRPLWLGLTARSFACGDGAFITGCSKTSGAEHAYLRSWTHMDGANYLTFTKTEDEVLKWQRVSSCFRKCVIKLIAQICPKCLHWLIVCCWYFDWCLRAGLGELLLKNLLAFWKYYKYCKCFN